MDDFNANKKSSAHLEMAEKMAHGILNENNPIDAAESVKVIYRTVMHQLQQRAGVQGEELAVTQKAMQDLNTMLDPMPDGRG